MQKNALLFGAILVIFGLLLGGYYIMNNGGSSSLATLGNTSLRSLLSGVSPQKCEFDNGQSRGTIYVANGKMRGDFESKVDTSVAKSHMVIANKISYVWLDGMKQGYRMAFDEMASGQSTGGQGIDADAKVATKCTSWQADETIFALPANVVFSEVAVPQGTQAQTTTPPATAHTTASPTSAPKAPAQGDYTAQQCAACAAVTDPEAKAQCIAVFDCPAQ